MNKQKLTQLATKIDKLNWIPLLVLVVLWFIGETTLVLLCINSPQYQPYKGINGAVFGIAIVISFVLNLWSAFYLNGLEDHTVVSYKHFLKALHAHDKTPQSIPDQLPIVLRNEGHDRHVNQAFMGIWANHKFEGVLYSCVKYDLNARENDTYHYLVIHFKVKHSFPYVLLNPIVAADDSDVGIVTGVQGSVAHAKGLQVEGSFNDTYEIMVQPNTGPVVLRVLTPDFMSELLDAKLPTTIEFAGHDVYIVVAGLYPTIWARELKHAQQTLDVVLHHLDDMASTWQASSTPQEIAKITKQVAQLR